MDKIGVIIVAGGSGTRMGNHLNINMPKQFLPLAGKPVLVRTVERFAAALPGAEIVVALPLESVPMWQRLAEFYNLGRLHRVCEGGRTRFHSVDNALAELGRCDYIAVHDGVRPLASNELILSVLAAARAHRAAIPVVEPIDSFRIMEGVENHPLDRRLLRAVQTPQIFRADLLRKAYAAGYDERFTDDASVVEATGAKITLVTGETTNIKITTPPDMALAEHIIANEDKI